MIIFDLSCSFKHRFEGWFESAEAFSNQLASEMVCCPVCGTSVVQRIPSVVHLGKGAGMEGAGSKPAVSDGEAGQIVAAYRSAVAELLKDSENVGARFAEEARRIHREGAPSRRIHGSSSDEEFEALQEEGIDVMKLVIFNADENSH
jgi:hypothetical protein